MSMPNPLALSERRMPEKGLLTGLSRFQRILMITDGTVNELLEQYLEEKIKVRKLFEKIEHSFNDLTTSHKDYLTNSSLPVLSRSITLEGQSTKKDWIYAESSILLDNLDVNFRSDLLASREPIGRLWEKYQYETYKTILDFEKKPAGELGEHFGVSSSSTLISRTYEVCSKNKPIMVITEIFPESFFKDELKPS